MINLSLPELILFVKYPGDGRINLLYRKIKGETIEGDISKEEILGYLSEKLTAFKHNYLKVRNAWNRMQNATNEEDDIKFQKEYEEIVAIAEFIDSTKARLNSNQEGDSSLNQYYREYLEMLVKAQSVEEFQNLKKCFELGMSNYKESLINSQQQSEEQTTSTYKK